MNGAFWVGVVLGAILSLLMSVLANLAHNRIVIFLDSRKLGRQAKRKADAIRFRQIVVELHSGARDKYIYMLRLAIGTTILVTVVMACGCIAVVVSAMLPPNLFWTINPKEILGIGLQDAAAGSKVLIIVPFFLLGLFGMYGVLLSTRRFRDLNNALERFDEFEAEFKKIWGDPPTAN